MTAKAPDKYAHVKLDGIDLKPGESWFLLRGQDKHTPYAMRLYAELIRSGEMAADILEHAAAIEEWQAANPEYVKEPD